MYIFLCRFYIIITLISKVIIKNNRFKAISQRISSVQLYNSR